MEPTCPKEGEKARSSDGHAIPPDPKTEWGEAPGGIGDVLSAPRGRE